MGIPYALSVHHFINSVGSDAGFASIIGLAILVFLYFAQMRETATLRDQATESGERVRQLESRLIQLQRAQAAAAQGLAAPAPAPAQALRQTPSPVRAPAAVTGAAGAVPAAPGAVPATPGAVPATPGAVPAVPGGAPGAPAVVPAAPALARAAPAGVGAPALTAATKLIPTDGPGGGVAVAPPPPAPAAPAPVPFDVNASPRPATAAGGANGGAQTPGGTVPPRVQIRPGAVPPGRRPASGRPFLPPEEPSGSRVRPLLYGLAGLVLVIAVVVVLLSLTGGGSSTPHVAAGRTTNAPAAGTKHKAKTVTVDPAKVTVAVLNGTATYKLATGVYQKLAGYGFKKGAITNAADQTHTTTTVEYLPGTANKDAALAVAQKLGLSDGSVQAIDPGTQAIACPSGAACAADVVVTVGSDLGALAPGGGASTGAAAASGTTVGTGTTATQPGATG